jgi:ribonuclease R
MIVRFKEQPELYNQVYNMYEELVKLGYSTSSQERRADQLERDVTKMKFAEYMQSHIGEEYTGSVSGFTKNGMFVQLPNTIEGMIPFKSINSDVYAYDDKRKMAVGRRSGEVFTIGTPLKISVRRASKDDSQIDFAYIKRLDKKDSKDDRKKSKRR